MKIYNTQYIFTYNIYTNIHMYKLINICTKYEVKEKGEH